MPENTGPGAAAKPKVSVIVAGSGSSAARNRLVDSLDVQTISRADVEVLFVHDGSSVERHDELQRIAESRPHARALCSESPASTASLRNVGLDHAAGEYLLFLDGEYALAPDALERAHHYAVAQRADVLGLRGDSTADPWRMLVLPGTENVPNVFHERGIARLTPMLSLTLYRREFLRENAIRFPDDQQAWWQDAIVTLLAYRHAKVVAVLADRPAFRWYGTGAGIDRADKGFWDRVDELLAFIVTTLDAPDYEDARLEMLAEHLRSWALDGLSGPPEDARRGRADLERARSLVRRYGSADVLANLPRRQRVQAELLRGSGMELGALARGVDLPMTATVASSSAQWRDGVLRVELECAWRPQAPDAPPLRRVDDRVRWVLDGAIADAVPGHLLDVTEDADELIVQVCARARHGAGAWNVPVMLNEIGYQDDENGAACLIARGEAMVDPASIAGGAPIASDVWDMTVRTSWIGFEHRGSLGYRGGTSPAVVAGRALVAYRSNSDTLALDTAGRERTLAVDARPRAGVPSPRSSLDVPLDNLTSFGEAALDAGQLVAVPEGDPPAAGTPAPTRSQLEQYATTAGLHLSIVPRAGGGSLQGSASLWPGRYRIYARRGGKLRRTAAAITVDSDGALTFV